MRNLSVILLALGYCALLCAPSKDAWAQDATPRTESDVTTSGLAAPAVVVGMNTNPSNSYPLFAGPIANPTADRAFESVGQSMGAGPMPAPRPPEVTGYACRDVDTFIIGGTWRSELGEAPPGYTDLYTNAIWTYANAMNSIITGEFRKSDVPFAVAPAHCVDPEGVCNCVSAEIQNSRACMKTVRNQAEVSKCVQNLYNGVRWCASNLGFCG